MCLTVEWDLLDTDSTEEEFDGSWKVDTTASVNQASRREKSNGGPLRDSAHRQTRRTAQEWPT
jgi:hypothetical protein